MKALPFALAALLLVLPLDRGATAMAATDGVSDSIRIEIAALLDAESRAWNAGDADAFAARALPDVVFTNIIGMFSVGKAPFLAQHAQIFATIYQGSRVELRVEHIALVTPDVAIVDTLAVLTGTRHVPPGIELIDGAVRTRLEQVLVRRADGWWVASFHNVAINPAALATMPPPGR